MGTKALLFLLNLFNACWEYHVWSYASPTKRDWMNTTRSLFRLHLMLEKAKRSRLPTALLNIDLGKAFDSVWVDGLLFKLLEHYISGKMYHIIKSFLKTRVASIELNGYQSPKLQIDIGVPQESVLSPLLFIIFLNDFLSNQAQKFKFADDSSLTATGKDPSESSAILRKTCSDIEK